MKKTIFIIVFFLLVACPLYAYEIDSLASIEGTVWARLYCQLGCWYDDHVGFYDGLIYRLIGQYGCFYTTDESRPAGYIGLSGISFFSYKSHCLPDNPLLCQRKTGVLFPSRGVGTSWCAGIPCLRDNHKLELLPDMSLPEDICPAGIRDYMMTRNPQEGSGCRIPVPTNAFYDHDKAAYCWVFSLASSSEDEFRCSWYKPNGELYDEATIRPSYAAGCWYSSISIKGDTPATTFGEWHVDVYLNGIKEFTKSFTIMASDYDYIEVSPPGWSSVHAHFINNNGVVVGNVSNDGITEKGFIYNNGTYTELTSSAKCINDSGVVVVGGSIYSDGTYTKLLPPGWNYADPFFINNSGTVVGWGSGDFHGERGFLYSEGHYTELLPPGWFFAYPNCINDSGVVIGNMDLGFAGEKARGFMFSAGEYAELLPPSCVDAQAHYINNNGVVVLGGFDDTAYKGFMYSNGAYTELLPPGWQSANANSINDSGVIVGDGYDGTMQKGFVYRNGEYTELFPPWSISNGASSINNSGVIVGWGADIEGKERAFIAVPKF